MSDFHLIAPRLPGAQGAISAAAVTATVPDPPRNFIALDNGTILRGTVQGRDKDGLIAVSTDQGILKIATNANLPAGSNVTLEVRSVGDRLQVVILAVDQGTAPAQTAATNGAATDQPAAQGAGKPGTGVPTAADHAGEPAAPANQPTVVVAGTRLTAIVIQSVPRDLIRSAATPLPEPAPLAKPDQAAPQNAAATATPVRSGTATDFRSPAPPPVQASLIPSIHDRIAALFGDAPDASDRIPDAVLLDADKAAARAASAIAPQIGTLSPGALTPGALAPGALTLNPEMRQRIIELFVGASAESPDMPPPGTVPAAASAARPPLPLPAVQVLPPTAAGGPASLAAPGASATVSSPVTAATQPALSEPVPSTSAVPSQAVAGLAAQGNPATTSVPTTAAPATPQPSPPTPQTPATQVTTAQVTTGQATPAQQAGSPQSTGQQPPATVPGSPPAALSEPAGEVPAPPPAPGTMPAPIAGLAATSPDSAGAPAPLLVTAAPGGQPSMTAPVADVPRPAPPGTVSPAVNLPLNVPQPPAAPDLPEAPLPLPVSDAPAAASPGTNAGPATSSAALPLPASSLLPSLAAALAQAGDNPLTNVPSAIQSASPPAIAGLVLQDSTVPIIPITPPVTPSPIAPPVTPTASANTATASDGKTATTAQPQGNAAGTPPAGAAPVLDNDSASRTAPLPLTAVVADASKLPLASAAPASGAASTGGTTTSTGGTASTGGAASTGGTTLASGAVSAGNIAAGDGATPAGGAAVPGNAALPSGATLADAQAEYQTLNTLGSSIGGSVINLGGASGAELPAGPLPTGTEVRLRVVSIQQQGVNAGTPLAAAQAASAGGKATIIGQILGHTPAGHPVIHSPVGDLVLQQQASLPVGASITLAIEAVEMANAGALNMPATPQMTALNLAQGWPTLLDLMLTLQHGPGAAAQPGSDTDPAGIARLAQPGSKLAADLNAAMDAFRSGDFEKLFGPLASALKTSGGKQDGVRKLRDEFTQLSMLAQDRPQQDWRSFFLPIWDDGRLQQINLFYRRQRRNQGEKDKSEDATRFVVEVNFTRLGNCQLDGLIRKKHFDLMVRSHQELPLNVKRDLSGLFAEARELGNYAGDISFQTTTRFPVVPLDDVVRDAPSVTA